MKRLFAIRLFCISLFLVPAVFLFSQDVPWKAPDALVEKLSAGRSDVNYREEKVPSYNVPGLLVTSDGRRVNNASIWEKKRREEVLELFRENVYGRVPSTPYNMKFTIEKEDRKAMEGKATLKQVVINIESEGKTLDIHLTVFVPNNVPKPVPAFLLINNREPANTDPERIVKSEFWPAEEVVARGYAIAAFHNADLDPDKFDDFKNGIHAVLDRGSRGPDSWGTISAWAWGASRCLDYFETDTGINSRKVSVVGHSRGGKTALWAAAEDSRFAMAVANESGCGGAALARRRFGETIEIINRAFPHWFCLNYRNWEGKEDSMPFDMHMLMALIAPRAVYVTSAEEDLWADPRGSYLSLFHSLPVYRLYDKSINLPEQMPPLNKPVRSGSVAYHIRDGVHNMLLKDWNWFMDFGDKILK